MKIITVLILISMITAPGSILFIQYGPGNDFGEPEYVISGDDRPPVSEMITVPTTLLTDNSEPVLLKWIGVDGVGGSDVRSFDIQIKIHYLYDPDVDARAAVMPYWEDYLTDTMKRSEHFYPEDNAVYYFRIRATDYAGNVEKWPVHYDASFIYIQMNSSDVKLPEHYEGVLERLIHRLEYIASQIVEIPENPDGALDRTIHRLKQIEGVKDDIHSTIRGIRENWPPVADAGEDVTANIYVGPYVYENTRDYIEAQIDDLEDHGYMEFNGSNSYDPDGNITSYVWDFGDGTVGYGEYVSHRYLFPGDYNVTLTVFDNNRAHDQDSINCHVQIISF